jgi:uncharacterized membrane protein YdbT with pleckstrin-like domain
MANYSETHLLRGEKIAYQTTYHWVHYFTLQGLLSLFIIPAIQHWTDEFVITNKRIIIKKGLIAIWTLEMSLPKIETVHVEQSIFGRILGYGCLTLIGTGGTKEKFHCIRKPIEFRKAFMEADINNGN